ncbi:MAG: type II secretion system ATPase GspE [Acidiferrobacterales bacterium]|nr:type II secretion system ATPase GspE [Acidiferrobacterales bacterium]
MESNPNQIVEQRSDSVGLIEPERPDEPSTVVPNTAADPASPLYWLERIDSGVVELLPYAFCKRHGVVAIDKGRGETPIASVVCVEKPGIDVFSEIRRRLNAPVTFQIMPQSGFEHLLRQAFDKGQSEATQMVSDLDDNIDLDLLASEVPEATDLLEASGDAPVVKLINALLTQAIRESASDIHLEVFEKRSLVRFRIDGILRDIVEPQRAIHSALISRLKVMAKLDIAEKRLPQDGRISLVVGDRPIDVRVSSLPTQYGERVVLRLLDKKGSKMQLTTLGMDDEILEKFKKLIHSAHGILLVTGPTGSGKTTSLYAGLSNLDRKKNNILTIEDPVEYDLDGVGQIQVHSRIGLTFASGLRSILRQDPDIVLVGEIRDLETAEIAVQASLTGHLVMSTLHTNTAIGAITRLIDMGVEDFLIASSLIGIVSQRLVRKLCMNCRVPALPDEGERELMGSLYQGGEIYRTGGCDVCDYTGYRGRVGIYELIVLDDELRTLIHNRASEEQMIKHVRKHAPSLLSNGVSRVTHGITSLEEVVRVTQVQ